MKISIFAFREKNAISMTKKFYDDGRCQMLLRLDSHISNVLIQKGLNLYGASFKFKPLLKPDFSTDLVAKT